MTARVTAGRLLLLALGVVACGKSAPPPQAPASTAVAATPTPPAEGAAAADRRSTEELEAGWGSSDGNGTTAEPARAAAPGAPEDAEHEQRCRDAAAHIVVLVRAGLDDMFAGLPPDQQAKAREEMEQQLREETLFEECLKHSFPPAQFDCVMAATRFDDLMSCEQVK